MKRMIIFVMVVSMLIMTASVGVMAAEQTKGFSDVPENAWYKVWVDRAVSQNIFVGDGSGRFNPLANILVGDFIMTIVKCLDMPVREAKPGEKYYMPYVEAALNEKLFFSSQFESYNRYIYRGEIAFLIAAALDRRNEEIPDSFRDYYKVIPDYNKINEMYKLDVAQCYAVGIIAGDNDGTFNFYNLATRAEASVMLVKLVMPEHRKARQLPTIPAKFVNGYTIPENCSVVAEDGGEFCKLYVSLSFLKNMDKQFNDARAILNSKLDKNTVDAALAYAKQKTDEIKRLPVKLFTTPDKKVIRVYGSGGSIVFNAEYSD